MNLVERIQALVDGKKIRRRAWPEKRFIYMDKSELIPEWWCLWNGADDRISNPEQLFGDEDWELYEEPVAEKVPTPMEELEARISKLEDWAKKVSFSAADLE